MTRALNDGLDLSIVSIDANKRVFPCLLDKVNRNRVDFVACDFSSLPFRDDTFCAVVYDLATSTSRRWEPFEIYAEFKRALRARASLFITDYYPEKSPRTKEATLATQASKLYRMVLEAKGTPYQKGIHPQSKVRQLRKVGFTMVKKKKIEANEAQEWKKRVFEEYCSGMKAEISSLSDSKLETEFIKKLDELRREIDSNGRINWAWGVNYLIQASK